MTLFCVAVLLPGGGVRSGGGGGGACPYRLIAESDIVSP